MANYHADYISAINEVKQWLSYKVRLQHCCTVPRDPLASVHWSQ